jgi:putative FmdB family regulatory protein
MPIYEYRCKKCGKAFEFLKKAEGDEPVCPECAGREVERLLSSFAVGKGGGDAANPCADCSGDPESCPRMGSMAGGI